MTTKLDRGTILVLAEELDPTADLVVHELNSRQAPVMRFDLSTFPQHLTLRARLEERWCGVIEGACRAADLEQVRAVYYRRPEPPAIADHVDEPYRSWARGEAVAGLLGVLYALPAVWVNRPDVDMKAAEKPCQLPIAAAYGLRIPRTLITNDPRHAREFARDIGGQVVCKSLHGGQLQHDNGARNGVPTQLIDPVEIDDSVRLTAHLFQEWIQKDHEVRLTVVGERMFAGTIHARSRQAHVDWRTDYDALEYGTTGVPDEVRLGVLAWMKHFGLNFGAFDFAVTRKGEWVMFECNPSGQWIWMQQRTGLPIAAAIADLLVGAQL
ncbi:ATP-grasp ribosomal peptide maturase [Tenggerimyces flavus]|uniref:ATP-grasp ribosomal peptide maturase n=1 Tax=Tenggerimyces flavus TaxID=1708749 RepID=A0ABV7Y7C7_9ACTN|nr:ATP-grasp ribosomal peptide maturase [Tenggerimyces flavus]MBM7785076.1 ATP-grasp ribosomal peptide maturase [Tenggerimyces flavus]